MGYLRAMLTALLLLAGGSPGCAQNKVDRHFSFTGYPTSPFADTATIEFAQNVLRDVIPLSTGHHYYNTVAGNDFGGAVTKANKAAWYRRAMDWISGGLADVTADMTKLTKRATEGLNSMNDWMEDLAPQLGVSKEAMTNFQRALKAYQLYRKAEVMSRAWDGALLQIDLLDTLPSWEPTKTDDFGVVTEKLHLGLTYKNGASGGDILSRLGLDNPFIGSWDAPRLAYKGPTKLSDIDLNISPSPYDGSIDKGLIQVGRDANELLDRTWFEGVMGRSMVDDGLTYSAKLQDDRPSPKLLKKRLETIAEARIQQINSEIAELRKLHSASPAKLAMMVAPLETEIQYWYDQPDRVFEGQSKRIRRLVAELAVTTNVTKERESEQARRNQALPENTGFLDSVFNTYKTIGELSGDLLNNLADNPDVGEDSGPRIIHKANVQYAKATYAAYLEAIAIRKLLHSRIRNDAQNRQADAFILLKKQMQRAAADVQAAQGKLENYQEMSSRILERLNLVDPGLTPEALAARVKTLRGQ